MTGPGLLTQDPGRGSCSHQETMLSHPLGWHPGISSHFLEPPPLPSLAHLCPWRPTILLCLCQGTGFPGTHLCPGLAQGRGHGGRLLPRLGLSSGEQGWWEGSPSLPQFLVPTAASCRAGSPPTSTQVRGLIWGPGRGTVTRKHFVHCHCPGPALQPFPREAGSLESGL